MTVNGTHLAYAKKRLIITINIKTHLLGSIVHEKGSAFVDSLQRLEVAVQPATAPMLHQLCQHYLH